MYTYVYVHVHAATMILLMYLCVYTSFIHTCIPTYAQDLAENDKQLATAESDYESSFSYISDTHTHTHTHTNTHTGA
jgi:hypothetical protein